MRVLHLLASVLGVYLAGRLIGYGSAAYADLLRTQGDSLARTLQILQGDGVAPRAQPIRRPPSTLTKPGRLAERPRWYRLREQLYGEARWRDYLARLAEAG